MSTPRRTRLTQQALAELMTYNRHTGVFTWRVYRSRTARPGMPAGTTHPDGTTIITIAGRPYSANRLAWLYVNGEWPTGRLTYVDQDPTNNRWANIMPESDRHSQSASAEYQRNRRANLRMLQVEHDTYNLHAAEEAALLRLHEDK